MSNATEQANQLLRDLDRGISLPASWYTDPAIVEQEMEHIFRKSWQYVGSTHELKNVGDYLTADVGGIPVVTVRNADGISTFVNVCRHRRHLVMKGCGNSKIMQCAYHAWTYDLSGCLKAAPRSDREPDFKLEDYPLLALKTELMGPFVFVNACADAKPLDSYYGKLIEIVAESGLNLDTMELWNRQTWESSSNWKTMLENFLECYHCPVAHPGFSAAIDVDQDSYKLTAYDWFSSQIGYVRESALAGQSRVKIYDARGAIKQAQYHLAWPNFTISINPGFPNIAVDVWLPNGAGGARGLSQQFFAPGVDKAWAEEMVEFNRSVAQEDDDLTNAVQVGLAGGIPDRGRFLTNSEHLAIHFQKLVVQALSGK